MRCSRAEQNVHLQEDETAEMIKRRGWTLVGTYKDEGISGTRERRPDLDRLLADARKGKFDAVVVWKADRLFRSLKNMAVTLDEWNALSVGFVVRPEAS
jgi:DNA invertase Pin-like site-specific DNA recombinase